MTCDEFKAALWSELDGEGDHADLRPHRESCPACRAYESRARRMHALIPEALEIPEAVSVESAVIERINEERRRREPAGPLVPVAALGLAALWYAVWRFVEPWVHAYFLPELDLGPVRGWGDAFLSGAEILPPGWLAAPLALAAALWISACLKPALSSRKEGS